MTINHTAPWYSFVPLLIETIGVYHPEKVIEWGTGISTAVMDAFAEIKEIQSFEHDRDWFKRYGNKYSNKVKCHLIPLGRGYSVAGKLFAPHTFDFAFIDGKVRVMCMQNAKNLVKLGGIIMLHDSERPEYQEGIRLFTKVKEMNGTILMINEGD